MMDVTIAPVAFVGRASEFDDLSRRLTARGTDGLEVIAVTGQPGVGKTALLRRFAECHPASRWAAATSWEKSLVGGVLAQLSQTPAPPDPWPRPPDWRASWPAEDRRCSSSMMPSTPTRFPCKHFRL